MAMPMKEMTVMSMWPMSMAVSMCGQLRKSVNINNQLSANAIEIASSALLQLSWREKQLSAFSGVANGNAANGAGMA
jgi:hypothetical protein